MRGTHNAKSAAPKTGISVSAGKQAEKLKIGISKCFGTPELDTLSSVPCSYWDTEKATASNDHWWLDSESLRAGDNIRKPQVAEASGMQQDSHSINNP